MSTLNKFRNSKVVVTGHTGFKGTWLCSWLIKLGANVTGISLDVPTNPSHFLDASIAAQIDDRRCDIRDASAISLILGEISPDFIFHLAAQPLVRQSYVDPIETWQTNTLGTVNVLSALCQLTKPCVAVFITSDKCYDNVEWDWGYRETDALGGPDPYSASKGAAELAIRSFVRSYFPKDGLVRIGVGRAGNVIGGGDWAADRIVPDCIRAWAMGNEVPLRNPIATRPWQHVLEPLSGYLNLAIALYEDNSLHGEAFNFGPPAYQNHSVGELVEEMALYWDKVRWVDVSANYGGPYESGLLKLNCDKALHHLKWRAVWGFKDTVRETVEWYMKYYQNSVGTVSDVSASQIDLYVSSAKEMGLKWAI
jgi:CDP-glucose 4,6-dehydratase